MKRKASSNTEMTAYQRCKLKIMNDDLKVHEEILRNLRDTNQKKIELLKVISKKLG